MPMDVKVNLDPVEVDRAVAEAIAKSRMGAYIQEAVDRALTGRDHSMHGETYLQAAVRDEIQRMAGKIIEEKYAEIIANAVKESMTNDWLMAVVKDALASAQGKMKRLW